MSKQDKVQLIGLYTFAILAGIVAVLMWHGVFYSPLATKDEQTGSTWLTSYDNNSEWVTLNGQNGQSSEFTGNFVNTVKPDVNQRLR